jgi:5'-nucleotidase/UDP-sugar diphosphatase
MAAFRFRFMKPLRSMTSVLPGRFTSIAAILLLAAISVACGPPRGAAPLDAPVEAPPDLVLLHLNDVYEVTPVEGGHRGGLARVAALRQRLLHEHANVVTVIGGDFFSPSALGTARVDGERLAGRQMVAVLNALGLDYATFGNHEFDLDEASFYARMSEAEFLWVSSNVTDAEGEMFEGVQRQRVLTFEVQGGRTVRVGVIGATIEAPGPSYVRLADPITTLRQDAVRVRDSVDVLVALTHLTVAEDVRLVTAVPEIDLVLGGHEHDNIQLWRGPEPTPILKADGNARSVYVIEIWLPEGGEPRIEPELVQITDALPSERSVEAEVDRWLRAAYAGFRASGFEPDRAVAQIPESLDGREATLRVRAAPLGELIAEAMRRDADAEAAFFNAGSVRLDDVLPAGPVTEYDVIRLLPFGGATWSVELSGELLMRTLDQGEESRGEGAFLQHSRIEPGPGEGWRIGGEPIDPERRYQVALSDYLLTGLEQGFGFLNRDNAEIVVLGEHRDVRMAVIDELRRRERLP